MIKNIINNFKNLESKAKLIMKKGLEFCSIIGIVALAILVTYNLSFTTPILFNIGLILFKLSLIFGVEFIICGLVVDKIKAGVI